MGSHIGEFILQNLLTNKKITVIIYSQNCELVKGGIKMTFADKLRQLREENELTQDQLAAELGITRRSIIKYELGEVEPQRRILDRIAEYFKIDPDILSDDSAELPQITSLEESYVNDIKKKYGRKAAKDMSELFSAATAFFAGGKLPQEEKDKFLKAMNKAYIRCREESSKRGGEE